MSQTTSRKLALLAGAAGLNLILGVGLASGVVPRPDTVDVASAGSVVAASDPVATGSGAGPEVATTEAPAETAAPETPAPPSTEAPAPTSKPSAAAAVQARAQAEPEPAPEPEPAAAAQAPATPPPTIPARPVVSVVKVNQAINTLAARIPLFRPTEAQAREFGDTVCTAFDQGSSYSDVRAGVLAAVGQIPLLTVTPADADFAISTAVNLFCPGHSSKLQ